MFECSTDYLLKDECISKSGDLVANSQATKSIALTTQKIIGYILLTVSLVAVVLAILLSNSAEELFVLIPITLSILVCSLICLFVEHKAGYWCAWVVLAPIALLLPFIVGFSLLNGLNFILLCFYVIMFFVAKKLFADKETSTSKNKDRLLIAGWMVLVGVRVFTYVSAYTTVISSVTGILPYGLLSLIVYFGVASLMTYTVCYAANIKRNRS